MVGAGPRARMRGSLPVLSGSGRREGQGYRVEGPPQRELGRDDGVLALPQARSPPPPARRPGGRRRPGCEGIRSQLGHRRPARSRLRRPDGLCLCRGGLQCHRASPIIHPTLQGLFSPSPFSRASRRWSSPGHRPLPPCMTTDTDSPRAILVLSLSPGSTRALSCFSRSEREAVAGRRRRLHHLSFSAELVRAVEARGLREGTSSTRTSDESSLSYVLRISYPSLLNLLTRGCFPSYSSRHRRSVTDPRTGSQHLAEVPLPATARH